MARRLDEGLLAVLRRMQTGLVPWMMARQIRADSTQYSWLLRHGYITRRDAWNYGPAKRWEYRMTPAGEALLSKHAQGEGE